MKGGSVGLVIGSVSFRNRVFLASGPAGYGTEYADLIKLDKLGGVVTKTITLDPWPGNPGRRLGRRVRGFSTASASKTSARARSSPRSSPPSPAREDAPS